jgi:nitroreductase
MELQELEKVIKGRRSVRKWMEEDVPEDLIKKAVELGTWAPNGGNFQGWRFVVVKNREIIEKLASAVQAVADKIASWPESAAFVEMDRYRKNASFFKNAPVVIATFVGQYQSIMDKALLARGTSDQDAARILGFRKTAPSAIQSMGAAVSTMLLVFHHMGLGAVWLGAPLMAKQEIETILKPPSGFGLTGLVAVGRPAESPVMNRQPVDQVLEFIR